MSLTDSYKSRDLEPGVILIKRNGVTFLATFTSENIFDDLIFAYSYFIFMYIKKFK